MAKHGSITELREAFAKEWKQALRNAQQRDKGYPTKEDVLKALLKLDKKLLPAVAVRVYQSLDGDYEKSTWARALDALTY